MSVYSPVSLGTPGSLPQTLTDEILNALGKGVGD